MIETNNQICDILKCHKLKNTQYKLKINVEAYIYISMAKKHLNEIFLLLAADK